MQRAVCISTSLKGGGRLWRDLLLSSQQLDTLLPLSARSALCARSRKSDAPSIGPHQSLHTVHMYRRKTLVSLSLSVSPILSPAVDCCCQSFFLVLYLLQGWSFRCSLRCSDDPPPTTTNLTTCLNGLFFVVPQSSPVEHTVINWHSKLFSPTADEKLSLVFFFLTFALTRRSTDETLIFNILSNLMHLFLF